MAYTRHESIYSGPFCDVYRATGPSGVVALKVVDPDFLRAPHDVRREVQLLRKLSHTNIVPMLDFYETGEDHVIVMPFYGASLEAVVAHFRRQRTKFDLTGLAPPTYITENRMPAHVLRQIVAGLLNGLAYIHANCVIHRDIKPANILVTSFENFTPVIADFGISYDENAPPTSEPPTHKFTDISLGYYKAPELCLGKANYGSEVDLWSLGIVISYLYSRDGRPANHVKSLDSPSPELNDLVLLLGTFELFGTPDVVDEFSETYWPELADPSLHFTKFTYHKFPRLPVAELLPMCGDENVKSIFSKLTHYRHRELEKLCEREKTA